MKNANDFFQHSDSIDLNIAPISPVLSVEEIKQQRGLEKITDKEAAHIRNLLLEMSIICYQMFTEEMGFNDDVD